MTKITFIHFLPLEYYPPATNMINYLADELKMDIKLSVFSTHNTKNRTIFTNPSVKIYRTAQSETDKNRIIRLIKYTYFQIFVLIKLIFSNPEKIIYYETLSSFPVYFYKRFLKTSVKIFIHYHEYTSETQYAKHSMAIERNFHKLEKKYLYKNASWISHTNPERLNLFYKDNKKTKKQILKELPNYPPKNWLNKTNKNNSNSVIKCVYIGSLSLQNTYLEEFTNWIIEQKGKVSLDIFAYNTNTETINYLEKINTKYVNFSKKGIEYTKIPELLHKYNVGIIMYKGCSENVINCVSNKFFEYYACGLDIWFSDVMVSTMKYVNTENPQKVIPLNFEKLTDFSYEKYLEKKEKTNSNSQPFFCENIYIELKKELENK